MRVISIITAILCVLSAHSQSAKLSGVVTDNGTGEPVAFATVVVQPGAHAVATDVQGRFMFSLQPGNYTVNVTFVGYEPVSRQVAVNSDQHIAVSLKENTRVLQEVVVTAKENTGMTSGSRIDRDAMAHLQPTSLTDLMELLPGNISHDPDMGSVNSIKLRETGTLGPRAQPRRATTTTSRPWARCLWWTVHRSMVMPTCSRCREPMPLRPSTGAT